jgi:hypothetical protein
MVERLAQVRQEASARPDLHPFLNAERAAHLEVALNAAIAEGNDARALTVRWNLARELLNAGWNEAALSHFDRVRATVQAATWRLDSLQAANLAIQTAVCYLRIAEQENCLANHDADACLLPLRAGGIHQRTRGSRGAVRVLSEHLQRDPNDLQARWLLNVASMTLGTYPESVPVSWRIPPGVFASDFELKRFTNVAGAAGLDVDDIAGGCITEDFDGDGWLDVLASSSSLTGQLRLFRNQGDGHFREVTHEAGLTGLVGGLNLVSTDYNNDGHADAFVLRGAWLGPAGHHPNSLLRNNGDGTFEDVTEEAGLLSFHPTQTATWFDFNGDGWLDVFIGNESTPGDVNPCELYRNNRDGTFTECAGEAGIALTEFVKGVASGDYNNDGRPDLYISNGNGPNSLLRNGGPGRSPDGSEGPWRFVNVAAEAGVEEPQRSFPTWFWDYDNDGWLDILVTGYGYRNVGDVAADYLGLPHQAERVRLYRNQGNGSFTNVTAGARLDRVLLAMGANFGDLDNDGWLDFYVGTGDPDLATIIPNRMFRNAEGRQFQDVTATGGFGHLQKGHGISFADLDNDGDQDVYLVTGGAAAGDHSRNALFLNPGHENRWLTLRLEGTASNRAAIGARLRLVLETARGDREIFRTAGTGGSFGASPFRQQIGCGQARSLRVLEVTWPGSGRSQSFSTLSLDRAYQIREGEDLPVELPLRRWSSR